MLGRRVPRQPFNVPLSELMQAVKNHRLEGIVAKRSGSLYRSVERSAKAKRLKQLEDRTLGHGRMPRWFQAADEIGTIHYSRFTINSATRRFKTPTKLHSDSLAPRRSRRRTSCPSDCPRRILNNALRIPRIRLVPSATSSDPAGNC
jgi:hypothetical protein